jgi:hypothetical protein
MEPILRLCCVVIDEMSFCELFCLFLESVLMKMIGE